MDTGKFARSIEGITESEVMAHAANAPNTLNAICSISWDRATDGAQWYSTSEMRASGRREERRSDRGVDRSSTAERKVGERWHGTCAKSWVGRGKGRRRRERRGVSKGKGRKTLEFAGVVTTVVLTPRDAKTVARSRNGNMWLRVRNGNMTT